MTLIEKSDPIPLDDGEHTYQITGLDITVGGAYRVSFLGDQEALETHAVYKIHMVDDELTIDCTGASGVEAQVIKEPNNGVEDGDT